MCDLIKLPKFGMGGGKRRYLNLNKYLIIFLLFLFSINIKSFGVPNYDGEEERYQISSKEDLIWFADVVNNNTVDLTNHLNGIATNAILTQDIEFNTGDEDQTKLQAWHDYGKAYADWIKNGAEAGKEPSEPEDKPSEEWTPIGNYNNKYKGKFNGNGKTISGLYFNENVDYVGLFGYAQNATIENIGVKNSYFKANDKVGGLIGYFYVGSGGTGEVSSSYSANCKVTGNNTYVGGLIGYFYVGRNGTGEVSSSYSAHCEVTGGSNVGGLIGYFYVYNSGKGEGEVISSYSAHCEVTGGSNVGGLIGYFNVIYGKGIVSSSYSANCKVTGTGSESKVEGVIGYFYVGSGGTGEVKKCFYDREGQGIGSGDSGHDITQVTDAEFKGAAILSGTHIGKTVLKALNEGFEDGSKPFKQDNEVDQDGKNRGSNYPVHAWSQRVAYVVGSGDQIEVLNREYVHKVSNYKLSEKIKIGDEYYSFTWKNYGGTGVDEVDTRSSSVTVYGKEKVGDEITQVSAEKTLKIPVRVKINYDPSNKLEKWVEDHVRHEFFRKTQEEGSLWEEVPVDGVSLESSNSVDNSVKINIDGSKTQDFIFTYKIAYSKYTKNSGDSKEYKFGFDKKYINVKDDSASYGMESGNAYMTYIKQDVGGGKQLFIDYDIDQDQILENYSKYTPTES